MNRLALVAAAALTAAMSLDASARTTYSSISLFDKLFFLHDPVMHRHHVVRHPKAHRPTRRTSARASSEKPRPAPLDLPTKIPTEPAMPVGPSVPPAPPTPAVAPPPPRNLGDDVIDAAQLNNPNCLTPGALSGRLAKVVNDNGGRMLVMDASDTKLFLDIVTADTPASTIAADLSVLAAFIDRDVVIVFPSRGGCVSKFPLRIGTESFVKAQQAVLKTHL